MATNKRMFSNDIVGSDAFLEMPTSTQALYFHLNMKADDDGFVNPKMIMRMVGCGAVDLQVLIGKKFVVPFENGVVVVKHWLINNNKIQKDRYKPTLYTEQKETLYLKDNRAYTINENKGKKLLLTDCYHLVNGQLPQNRLEEIRIEENITSSPAKPAEIKILEKKPEPEVSIPEPKAKIPYPKEFDLFWQKYPRKTGKSATLRKWSTITKKIDGGVILSGLEAQINAGLFQKEEQFIKHPEVWLNKGCWEDEVKKKWVEPARTYPSRQEEPEMTEVEREAQRKRMKQIRESFKESKVGDY